MSAMARNFHPGRSLRFVLIRYLKSNFFIWFFNPFCKEFGDSCTVFRLITNDWLPVS